MTGIRIAVIGATGVLGRAVLPRLVERGHSVRAIVRSPVQAAHFLRLGIDAGRRPATEAGRWAASRGLFIAAAVA